MDADLGPEADPAMAILTNRLPYMDRETLCKEHGYNSCIKWLPCRSKVREDADGKRFNGIKPDPYDYHGAFAEASLEWELQEGEGLPGRAFMDREQPHFAENLQAEDSDDPRKDIAKKCNVTGSFAVFRDGAVWEFVQEHPQDEKARRASKEVIEGFGGSTAGGVAFTTALAAVKLKGKLGGKFKKKEDGEQAE